MKTIINDKIATTHKNTHNETQLTKQHTKEYYNKKKRTAIYSLTKTQITKTKQSKQTYIK